MTRGAPSLLRFADFEVNIELGEVRRYGHRIKLQDKPFQILTALLERPGALVSREELHQRLWSGDTFVDFDHNLNNAIDKLRKALNDSADQPRFIETLPRRGYRFIAAVERSSVPFPQNTVPPLTERTAHTEAASPSIPTAVPDTLPGAQVGFGTRLVTFTTSERKLIIGSALVAFLLLISLFVSHRFFGLANIHASSVHGKGTQITSLEIGHSGALDPLDVGFQLQVFGRYRTEVMRNASNYGWDRLKIRSEDQAYYYRTLTAAEKRFALSHDWKLICICGLEEGQLSTNVDFGPGLRRFDIELLQEGDKYYVALTKRISPEIEWEQKMEFPGAHDIDSPHTYELRFDHVTQTASLWVDGRLMASGYHGHTQFLEDRGVFFGSYSYLSAKTGIGVFRSVRFEVH